MNQFTPLTQEEENFLAQVWETMRRNRKLAQEGKRDYGTTLQNIWLRWRIPKTVAMDLLWELGKKKVAGYVKHYIGLWPGPPDPRYDSICLYDRGYALVQDPDFPDPVVIARSFNMARPTEIRRLNKARVAQPCAESEGSTQQASG